MFTVVVKKAAAKGAAKMPERERILFGQLAAELEALGPVRSNWPNYSKLGAVTYHCHLSRKWVACWQHESDTIKIEVYYAGNRENAPY